MLLERLVRRIRLIMSLTETSGIARRYFALNAFDGALIGLGAIFGFYISEMHDYKVALLTITAIAVGSAISGFSGAFISEKLEQEARVKRLEEAILTDLKDSIIYQASLTGSIIVSIINGFSSLISIFCVSAPYVICIYLSLGEVIGILSSIITFFVVLTALGYLFGKELKIRTLRVVSRILLTGIVATVIYFLIELIFQL